jgi:lipopolysaccharide/colanic/teichoic acid biosynthesis glycosyltransferase
VMFTQQRTGLHGRRFRMFKFRTMVANAEELKASLQHLNILPPPDFKIIDDPRITRVGRILRRSSLDELPQIINVLLGDMSFVGPRPTSFAASTYDVWHTERLEVTPGITGLWQVHGRNWMTFDERLRLDIEYVRTISLGLDLKIIARTVISAMSTPGA